MTADIILYSEAIFDSVKDQPFAGGIAIKGKKIQAVGSREEISRYRGEATKVIDCGSRLVMPGFIDSHAHFDKSADEYYAVTCDDLDQYHSEEECAKRIGEFAQEHPELPYYIGKGWALSYWGEGAVLPTRHSIDKYVPDKAVYLNAGDGHSMWMNTKAVEVENIKAAMSRYPAENILAEESGEPTGLVREVSLDLNLWKNMVDDLEEPERSETKRKNQKGLIEAMNAAGLTGFSDVSMYRPEELTNMYQYLKELNNKDELNIRMYVYPGTDFETEPIKDIKPYEAFFNTDELRITGMKSVVDGVTSSYTAYLTEPYEDAPDTRGLPTTDPETLKAWVMEANRNGYGCRLHCIGDGAVRMALDAYEYSNQVNDNSDIRNAVEHIELVHPDDIPRFAKLGVTASMQPLHQIIDKAEKLIRCGRERSRYEWAFRSILDAGGRIAFGTDYNVVDFKPYPNIYAAITMRDMDGTQYGSMSPGEVVTLPEAIKCYTIEGARINHMETKTGTLEPGKYADITVADCNLFDIPTDSIKDCSCTMTIFNGKIVYKK